MKTLSLFRHAKSDWKNDVSDIDRPLNQRGIKDAAYMGEELKKQEFLPSLIMSSTAERASTTAKIICDYIHYPEHGIIFKDDLYLCNIRSYLQIIEKVSNNIQHIALFSHNPGTTLLLNYLCDENIDNVPTCGFAKIDLQVDTWEAVSASTGILTIFLSPKMLKNKY